MNELRFLEIIGKIDDDLIQGAMTDKNQTVSRSITKGNICAFGSVAAVAVVALGINTILKDNKLPNHSSFESVIQTDNISSSTSVLNNTVTTTLNTVSERSNSKTFTSNVITQNNDENNAVNTITETSKIDIIISDNTESQTVISSKSVISSKYDINTKSTTTTAKSSKRTTSSTAQPKTSTKQNVQTTSLTTAKQKGGVATENCYYQPFIATIDTYSDSFSEEEDHHIDVRTADGFYRQLSLNDYESNGISASVSASDFGGYIGKIVEVSSYDYCGNAAESQEPTLAGADVYYYAPTGKNKAFIIVKSGDQCSIFAADNINTSSGFKSGLAFFDVQSADDIYSIEYRIEVPENGRFITSVQNTITDNAIIGEFYDLLCQFTPEDYSQLPEHAGSPQWLVDAWESYRNDPDPLPREDYRISIKLKDGTVLQEIHFQPYLGNGYVQGMKEITPEQNNKLKEFLN